MGPWDDGIMNHISGYSLGATGAYPSEQRVPWDDGIMNHISGYSLGPPEHIQRNNGSLGRWYYESRVWIFSGVTGAYP